MMMTDARGKLGGQVFSKNRGGSFVRTKVTPANPQTSSQSLARSRFALLNNRWNELTEEQRIAWNAIVGEYSRTDIFGDLRNPTGKNLFVGLNSNLIMTLQDVREDPTSPVALYDCVGATLGNVTNEEIVLNGAPVIDDQVYMVQSTSCVSAGIFNFTGKYKNIGIIGGSATAQDLINEFLVKYGIPIAGRKIAFNIKAISTITGQASSGVKLSAVVTVP